MKAKSVYAQTWIILHQRKSAPGQNDSLSGYV